MKSAKEIVNEYQAAMDKGDVVAARNFLADDMKFHGPLDTFDKPEPYLNALKQLAPILERVEVKKIFADGDEVARFCDLHFRPPLPKTFVGEWFVVRGGKIVSIRIAFDARPFATMMPH
ncbi:MAG: nuclear transport factor 2 family protein [Thermoplasmata archaeon]